MAFVVRLKSIVFPTSAARLRAYAMVDLSTGKFSSVSPPKNVMCATRPLSFNSKSTAVAGRRLGHELRLFAVLGVDDLVLAVLVAVRAGEVALVGDVQNDCVQRKRHHRQLLRQRLVAPMLVANGTRVQQIDDRLADDGSRKTGGQARDNSVLGARRSLQEFQNGLAGLIELEDGRTWNEIENSRPPPRNSWNSRRVSANNGAPPFENPSGSRSSIPLCGTMTEQFREALKYVVPYRRRLVVVLSLSLLSTVFSLILPYLTRSLVDRAFGERDLQALYRIVEIFAFASVAGFVVSMYVGLLYTRVSADMLFDMRLSLYTHLQRLSPRFYARVATGEILARVNNDVAEIQRVVSESVLALVGNVFFLCGSVTAMFWLDARLALVGLSLVPASTWLLAVNRRRLGVTRQASARDKRRCRIVPRGNTASDAPDRGSVERATAGGRALRGQTGRLSAC